MQGEVSTPRNTDGWDSVELKEQKGMNYFVPPLLKATDEIKAWQILCESHIFRTW